MFFVEEMSVATYVEKVQLHLVILKKSHSLDIPYAKQQQCNFNDNKDTIIKLICLPLFSQTK